MPNTWVCIVRLSLHACNQRQRTITICYKPLVETMHIQGEMFSYKAYSLEERSLCDSTAKIETFLRNNANASL